MVICMVYWMTFFNKAIDQGLSYGLFLDALREMWPEVCIAFLVQRYIARKNADRLVKNYLSVVKGPSSFFIPVINAAGNVMIMAPIMTFLINLLHNGFTTDLGLLWCKRVIFNFPFALCIQTFYVGPFVKFVYKKISRFL
jgi:hypothetical protein